MADVNTVEKKLVYYFTSSEDPKAVKHTITIKHPKQDLSDGGEKGTKTWDIGSEIAESGMFATAEGLALDTFQGAYYESVTKNPIINNKVKALEKVARLQADKIKAQAKQ